MVAVLTRRSLVTINQVRSTVRCAEKQLSTMRFPPAAEVLDLGAGPGLMTVLACRRHRGCTCTALDSFDAVMRADLESNMIAEYARPALVPDTGLFSPGSVRSC